MAFNLPGRPTISSTVSTTVQTPSSVATQAQQMYYAYPAPSGDESGNNGGVVNIGFSSTVSTMESTVETPRSPIGYNYGLQESNAVSSNAPTMYNPIQSTSLSNKLGYGDNTPSITAQSPIREQSNSEQITSTNAPKYLPPLSVDGQGAQQSNFPSSQGSSTFIPMDISGSYLQPSANANIASNQEKTQENVSITASNGYSAPNTLSTGSTQSALPTSGYLPPRSSSPSSSTQVPVSTPAQTYLPPLLK